MQKKDHHIERKLAARLSKSVLLSICLSTFFSPAFAATATPTPGVPVLVPTPPPTIESLAADVNDLKHRMDETEQNVAQGMNKLNKTTDDLTKIASDIELIKMNTSNLAKAPADGSANAMEENDGTSSHDSTPQRSATKSYIKKRINTSVVQQRQLPPDDDTYDDGYEYDDYPSPRSAHRFARGGYYPTYDAPPPPPYAPPPYYPPYAGGAYPPPQYPAYPSAPPPYYPQQPYGPQAPYGNTQGNPNQGGPYVNNAPQQNQNNMANPTYNNNGYNNNPQNGGQTASFPIISAIQTGISTMPQGGAPVSAQTNAVAAPSTVTQAPIVTAAATTQPVVVDQNGNVIAQSMSAQPASSVVTQPSTPVVAQPVATTTTASQNPLANAATSAVQGLVAGLFS